MNKLLVAILLCFSNIIIAQDFEKSNWTDSKEQVITNNKPDTLLIDYSARINSQVEFITYTNEIKDLNCFTTYYFANNTLQMGTFIFLDVYTDYDKYLKDYKTINKYLRKKHGKSTKKGSVYNNTCIYPKLSKANLIAFGCASHYAEYNNGNIYLEISGKNGSISITLIYISPNINDVISDFSTYTLN